MPPGEQPFNNFRPVFHLSLADTTQPVVTELLFNYQTAMQDLQSMRFLVSGNQATPLEENVHGIGRQKCRIPQIYAVPCEHVLIHFHQRHQTLLDDVKVDVVPSRERPNLDVSFHKLVH